MLYADLMLHTCGGADDCHVIWVYPLSLIRITLLWSAKEHNNLVMLAQYTLITSLRDDQRLRWNNVVVGFYGNKSHCSIWALIVMKFWFFYT